jgi:hypothetical protein
MSATTCDRDKTGRTSFASRGSAVRARLAPRRFPQVRGALADLGEVLFYSVPVLRPVGVLCRLRYTTQAWSRGLGPLARFIDGSTWGSWLGVHFCGSLPGADRIIPTWSARRGTSMTATSQRMSRSTSK